MRNKKGFTLTEVLLAVMIVGLIGVALAALTRASARESGVGRSKTMLRNNLSSFMRTLRGDLNRASSLEMRNDDNALFLVKQAQNSGPDQTPRQVLYCFYPGSAPVNIQPAGATRGGTIYRISSTDMNAELSCSKTDPVLANIKGFILNSGYESPRFTKRDDGMLRVELVVELPTKPIVNDSIDETFALPVGL